jgi:hypothetical protein
VEGAILGSVQKNSDSFGPAPAGTFGSSGTLDTIGKDVIRTRTTGLKV